MSKSEEIRRMRERQYALREHDAVGQPKVPSTLPPPAAPADAEAPAPSPRAKAEEQGRCSGCGKTRALVTGLVTVHQKGLGKICPGSRKEPA